MFDYQALTAVLSAGLTLAAGYITASQANQKKAIARAHERIDELHPRSSTAAATPALEQSVDGELIAELVKTIPAEVMTAAAHAVLQRHLPTLPTNTP
jgi:hypothetical protein